MSELPLAELILQYKRCLDWYNHCLNQFGDWGVLLGLADNFVELNILEEKIMNHSAREEYAAKLLAAAKQLRETKGAEYSRGESDVNSNFARTGADIDLDPIKVVYIFMKKHFDSITSFVKTGHTKSEDLESRLADMINYCIILGSLEWEKQQYAHEVVRAAQKSQTVLEKRWDIPTSGKEAKIVVHEKKD